MKGFSAKEANRSEKEENDNKTNLSNNGDQVSNELSKLNDLFQSGALSEEEFEKAKKKILDS